MDVVALQCVRCGGPLTRPQVLPALVDCVYCGTAISVSRDHAALAQPATPVDVVEDRRRRFHDALVAGLERRLSPYAAVRDAAAAHLELGEQAETAARVAVALVRDFERDSGVDAATQPMVLARIVGAYLRALDTLRTQPSARLDLPFLTADATGPKHLQRTVTAHQLAELAARDPGAPRAAPVPSDAGDAPAPAPKKRWWWPFG